MIVELTKYGGGVKHKIAIEIDEEGNIAARVDGVKGPACSDISKILDDLGEVVRDEKTPEYYQAARQQSRERAR